MTRRGRRVAAVLLLPVLLAATASCSSDDHGAKGGFNAALKGVVNPSDARGGTLRLGTTSLCPNFDPATTYAGNCFFLQRFLSRTLVAYGKTGVPGRPGNGGKLVGDLATGRGTANADRTEWTYRLRAGLKWDTGAPVTSADVKYGVERAYATDVITSGVAAYFLCVLDTCDAKGAPRYKGPYADKTGGLDSIETPDARTVVFKLRTPTGDWDSLMALPALAPVHQAYDKGARYGTGTNLVSSGPYSLDSLTPNREAVFTRNKYWARSSDPVRRALPDRVTIAVQTNADDLDIRLKTGNLDASLDGPVQTTFQSQIINTASLKARADNPTTTQLTMLVLYPSDPAMANVHCRRAVAYAVDKQDALVAAGGTYGGKIATTLLPPQIPGYDAEADAYPSGAKSAGDLAAARKELTACGRPKGFSTKLGYSNFGYDPQLFAGLQSSLKRVGISVEGRKLDSSSSYTVLSTPSAVQKQGIGMATLAWAPDYLSGNGFLTLLVDPSRYTGTSSSTNLADVDDPAINKTIKQAKSATPAQQAGIYKTMDAETMRTASYVPLHYTKALLYRNARVTNADLSGNLNRYDFVNLGVK